MDTPHPLKPKRRGPWLTLFLLAGALVVSWFPGWTGGLIYDRQAILAGEFWRLYTGHWVHFSPSHLVYDALMLGLAGTMLESHHPAQFGRLCVLAPWVINGLLLVFAPRLQYCGGLSGLATCVLVFLALEGLGDRPNWRIICLMVLTGVAAKIFFEWQTGRMLFASVGTRPIQVSAASHLASALTALFFWRAEKIIFYDSPARGRLPAGLSISPPATVR